MTWIDLGPNADMGTFLRTISVVTPTGTSADAANIQAALTAMAAVGGKVVLKAGTYSVTTDVTGASNVVVEFMPGAILDVSSTKTVTLAGPVYGWQDGAATGSGSVLMQPGKVAVNASPLISDALVSPRSRGNNLLLWIYGEAGVTQASNLISNWADQSQQSYANRDYVASGGFRPTYTAADAEFNNRGTATFNGSGNWMANAGAWGTLPTQPYTIYLVGKSTGAAGVFFASGAGSNRSDIDVATSFAHAYAGSNLTTTTLVTSPCIITVVFNGASSAIYVNGSLTAILAGDVGAQTISQTYLGGNYGGGNLLTGKIASVIITRGADTARQRSEMLAYLGAYYGITVDSGAKRLVICDGDSLTAGTGSTAGQTYPVQLIAALGSGYEAINDGTGGHTVVQMLASVAPLDEYIAVTRPRTYYVGWGGGNDIYTSGTDAGALFANYVALLRGRRVSGAKVVACTQLPRSIVSTPSYYERQRLAFNAMVRSQWRTFADALADMGANTTIGLAGSEMNTTYFDPDRVHMTNAGYAIVAGLVQTAILSIG
jgi:lysophospholipase L1-like esterase